MIILYSLRDRERTTPGGLSFWITSGGLSIRFGSNPKVLTIFIGIKRRAGAPALAHFQKGTGRMRCCGRSKACSRRMTRRG
jgi:hypothetical protein